MKLTAEDYAEKVFLKIGKSRNKPATIRLLFDLVRKKSNSIKTPDGSEIMEIDKYNK